MSMQHPVLAIASFAVGAVASITAAILHQKMLAEVNKVLDESSKISPFWTHFEKTMKVRKIYWKNYPDGKLHVITLTLQIIGASSGVLFAYSIGMFS